MNNITFGKYVNNHSFLTKMDARVKIAIMVGLLVCCFMNFNIIGFSLLFGFLCLLMFIGKLSFKSLFKIVKHMWFLFLMLLVINLFTIKGEVLFEIGNFYVYKDAVLQTIYVFLRIVMLLMISTLLSSSTTPSELTYALEFYLVPLKVFKINIHEIAIMVSIALRFIPTLIDEMDRIKKALTSLIIPLFISCFDKADELTNAMVARGYDSDMPRSKYKHLSTSKCDLLAVGFVVVCLAIIVVLNGVIL